MSLFSKLKKGKKNEESHKPESETSSSNFYKTTSTPLIPQSTQNETLETKFNRMLVWLPRFDWFNLRTQNELAVPEKDRAGMLALPEKRKQALLMAHIAKINTDPKVMIKFLLAN